MIDKKTKLMIVEDEVIVALEIKERLQSCDYDVPVIIKSGEEVVEAARKYRPDLILMDIKLKGKTNGIEATHTLNTQLQIPVVFLTAYGDRETLVRARRTNPYGFIIKPFQDQELIATIEMAINRFRIEKELEENRNYFLTILSSIDDGVITTDIAGYITFINPVAERLTGWNYKDALGKQSKYILHIAKDMAFTPVDDPVQNILSTGCFTRQADQAFLISLNGDKIPIDTSGGPIKDKNNETIGVVLVFRDISEKIQVEQEKMKLEKHLHQAEKMEAIGQLSAGIAHDFNNQLTGIQMFAELILDESGNNVIEDYITQILTLVNRSTNLTKQLLAFSQKGKYQVININIHNIIKEVVSILKRSIDKRIQLKLQLHKDPPVIACDPSLIQNAVLNLALNARDAISGDGKILFTTKILYLEETGVIIRDYGIKPGHYVELCVIDDGKGMTSTIMKHIFEPFFTTKENGKGTGMGLAAVYGTVKNHNGAIRVTSSPGKGSVFALYLPVLTVTAKTNKVDDKKTLSKLMAHILYIDDEEMLRISVKFQLESQGFKVSIKKNGDEAIKEYRNNWKDVDVVLLDMIMPELNGKDTFIEMKKINPDIKAIILSGYYTDEEIRDCIDIGIKGFLKKPFTRDELVGKIKSIL